MNATLRKLFSFAVVFAPLAFSVTAADASPQALMEAGHWKRLRQMVEPQAADPKNAQAAYFLSCVLTAYEDFDRAIDMAKRAVSLEPNSSGYHLQLAVALGRKANKASVLKVAGLIGPYKTELKKAVDLDPKNLDALWESMEFYQHAPGIAGGDKNKARSLAEDIKGINPAKGYLALAELVPAEKEADLEDYYRKAAEADPQSFDPQIRLAGFYLSEKHKNHAAAEKHAQQAISLAPGRTAGYRVMAVLLTREDRWQDLDALLAKAESAAPDDLSAHFQAGVATLLAGKDPARAERYLRKYLTQEPEAKAPHLSRAHWRIGQALEKQSRKPEAIAEIETALRLEPDLEEAKKDLKRLKN